MIRELINSAKELGLTEWDWVAIVISILSFTASVISIGIAFKTLKSQVKTQNNTRLLLSQNAGYEYLKSYTPYIIISYMHLSVFDNITKKRHIKHEIIYDYIPTFFYGLLLPQEGIRPDQFISFPDVYDLLFKISSYIKQYNELVDYIKNRIIEKSIKVQFIDNTPVTFIKDAQNRLKQISRLLIQTIMIIKSENEKDGEQLSQYDIESLQSDIDTQILEFFNTIKDNREVHSKELDECVFDDSILDFIIKDSTIKETVSSIYCKNCRVSFFDSDKFLFFRKKIKPNREEMIIDEIRAIFFKGEADKAICKINGYFAEDINRIGRKALTFCGEEMQNGFFKKEVRRIRKFYISLYDCVNSSVPQSLESIDFDKWKSFNVHSGLGPWNHPIDIQMNGDSFVVMA